MIDYRSCAMVRGGWGRKEGAPLLLLLLPCSVYAVGSKHVVSLGAGSREESALGAGSNETGAEHLVAYPLAALKRQPRTEGNIQM